MKIASKPLYAILIMAIPAACAPLGGANVLQPDPETTRPVMRPLDRSGPADEGARTVEEFDTTSDAQRVEAVEGAREVAGLRELGRTVASLGDPTRPGFWLETPLVGAPGNGKVVNPANGKAVLVELIPIAADPGAASRISLAAMRLLGVALTDLPELIVYGP